MGQGSTQDVGTDSVSSMLLAPEIVAPVAALAEVYETLPARWTFIGPLEPVREEPNEKTEAFWPVLASAHQV